MKKLGIVAVVCVLGGCGSSSGYVCDYQMSGTHVCETISDPGSDASALDAACTAYGGTQPVACSTSEVLGVCTASSNGVAEVVTYYTGGAMDAAAAETDCTSTVGGKWTAG
jgi:hypothetical protein